MKNLKLFFAAIIGVFAFAACNPEEEATPVSAPSIECTPAEATLNLKLGASQTFQATVESTVDYTCAWYLNDEKISSTEKVTYVFKEKGTFTVKFVAENEAGSVNKTYTVNVTGEALVVSFDKAEGDINLTIGDELVISATVTSGDKSTTHSWTVDGEEVSTSTLFSYSFNTPGTYAIAYAGKNADDETASASWTAKVSDLPLDVEFSAAADTIKCDVGVEMSVVATPVAGVTGVTYAWTLGGEAAGTDSTFVHTFAEAGTYALAVKCENAAGEKVEKSWVVVASVHVAATFMYDDFENGTSGVSTYYIGNNVSNVNVMSVVENPYKTDANPSNYCLIDEASKITWSSSGYFKFKINATPSGKELSYAERSAFSKVRVKVYVGETGFTPLLQEDAKSTKSTPSEINGIAFDTANPTLDAWKAAIKTNDWNVFVYDFKSTKYSSDVNNLGQTDQLQFRVTVDFKNNGQIGKDVYFDDIEFLE